MIHAIAHLRAADPVLADVIDAVGPYEFTPSAHGFHTLADAIISQQISIKAAAAIMGRLEQLLGEVAPAQLLAVTHEELRTVGLSGQKARYLRDLAERTAAGALKLDALPALDDDSVIAQLTAVKGIGRWTAEIYLMFALGRPDVLPADDLGLRYAVQQFYQLPVPPPPVELRRIGEPWRPYRSVASWYLWRGRRI
jgi:DNA-3-methyladenine glycosylase II